MQSSNSTTILQPPETGHEKINNNNGGGGVSSPPRNTQTRLPKSSAFERIHSPHSILSPVAEVPRRNSLSEMTFEDAKSTLLSTTGGVLIPTATDSTWHSIPLAFAMLPAIAGAIFTNGEGLTTDILLLSLVAIFLHWFVKFPW